MSKDGPLNNNSFFRGISDKLDNHLGQGYKSDSMMRGALHGTYHLAQCYITDNQRECERAKDQFSKITGGPSNNLKKYDESK